MERVAERGKEVTQTILVGDIKHRVLNNAAESSLDRVRPPPAIRIFNRPERSRSNANRLSLACRDSPSDAAKPANLADSLPLLRRYL